MGYVPGCRYDLFISYARENNRDAWVEQFVKSLGEELADLLGRQFKPQDSIFLDKKELHVGQSFPEELTEAARQSAILVPVLSPSYLTSSWCYRERTAFFSRLSDGAEESECLAPIVVRPINEDALDGLYRNAQRMSFLSPDGQTPLAVGSSRWIAQLREFVAQLKSALQSLREKCKPVFLGKTADTERFQRLRERCCAELEHRYLRTVPDSPAALDDRDAVEANLEGAGLAIHFLGGAAAVALEAIETSVSVCPGPTILYQPFGVDLVPDEKVWLSDFESQLQALSGRYQRLAQKNDQELLAVVDEQIKNVRAATCRPITKSQLALICEAVDLEEVQQLKEAIKAKGYPRIESPDFVGKRLKAMEVLRSWDAHLGCADALLFYYGFGERTRLEALLQKAEKDGPDVRHDWFLAPPDLEHKRQQYPEALWELDHVVAFIEGKRGAHA